MNGHKLLTFRRPPEMCDCAGRVGGCRWFKCGQPGPQEHAYKCEVFYATAGNFLDEPERLRNISLVIAHVLAYTEGPPHIFGLCGKLWTLAALQYRMRDGPLSSSMAVLLTPRPAPVSLVPFIQKLTDSEKPYKPRSHRFLDTNPFNGLRTGRHGVERKLYLTHMGSAVWVTHVSWLARGCLGGEVNWQSWQLDHIAPRPSKLLAYEQHALKPSKGAIRTKRFSTTAFKDRPQNRRPLFSIVNDSSIFGDSSDSSGHVTPRLDSPPALHVRPRSFAGFAEWDLPGSPLSMRLPPTGPTGTKAAQRKSCIGLEGLSAGGSPGRPLPEPPIERRSQGIMVIQNDNDSTYFLANETLPGDDNACGNPTHLSPLRYH